jgi:hypothetical protein
MALAGKRNEVTWMSDEVAMTSRYLPEGAENHEKPKTGWEVCGPRRAI